MKRATLLVLLSLLLALFLVACGGSEGSESAATEANESASTSETAVEAPADAGATCTDAIGCVEVAPGDPIMLASSLVVSGPNTELGLDSQYGVEIAIDLRGEIMGHAIELQPEDDGCSAEGGQTSAQKIVSNPQIVAIIGTSCSGAGVDRKSVV